MIASDLRLARMVARMAPDLVKARGGSSHTVADAIESVAKRSPDATALVMGGSSLTYAELEARASRVARWALDHGLGHGDVVALLGANRPEYVAHWLGFAKIGATTALINNNLTGAALWRSVELAGTRHLVLDKELETIWEHAAGNGGEGRNGGIETFTTGGPDRGADFDVALSERSPHPLDHDIRRDLTIDDNLFYIYTSGTTGLPKAAKFSHLRYLMIAAAAKSMAGYRSSDNIYCPLPLYHTVGGVMATGSALLSGATAVLAPRFSASSFWSDCVEHDVTAFQYIGELCRYLLNSAPHPDEGRHLIRVCIGNGLRPDIWPEFRDRFRLDHIIEFYGATEGNVTFFNLDDKVGSIGRSPALMRRLAGVHLVQYDIEREQELRGPDGFCVEAEVGHPGEAIAKITSAARFEGYSDDAATEKKILRDVFRRGDAYFRTGDLLSRDRDDYFYFLDRIGDTFRWKGENVSTTEVAESLAPCPGILEINVYGVRIPGCEGRIGMAAIVTDVTFDLDNLTAVVNEGLPSYARPGFLRIRPSIDTTATLKYRKVEAVNDGFDPSLIDDPLYFLDPSTASYNRLDRSRFDEICSHELRL